MTSPGDQRIGRVYAIPGVIVGVIMLVAGITRVIPWLGWPGVIWTLIAAVVAGYNTYSFLRGGFVVARRPPEDDGQAEGK